MIRKAHMTINSPSNPGRDDTQQLADVDAGRASGGASSTRAGGAADTHEFGDLQVSTGRQSAYVTVELILYLLATIGIFLTAAVIDESGSGQGFGASEAWFYVTLLTVGFFLSRGLAKLGGRNDRRVL
jgi:hypothetical protein